MPIVHHDYVPKLLARHPPLPSFHDAFLIYPRHLISASRHPATWTKPPSLPESDYFVTKVRFFTRSPTTATAAAPVGFRIPASSIILVPTGTSIHSFGASSGVHLYLINPSFGTRSENDYTSAQRLPSADVTHLRPILRAEDGSEPVLTYLVAPGDRRIVIPAADRDRFDADIRSTLPLWDETVLVSLTQSAPGLPAPMSLLNLYSDAGLEQYFGTFADAFLERLMCHTEWCRRKGLGWRLHCGGRLCWAESYKSGSNEADTFVLRFQLGVKKGEGKGQAWVRTSHGDRQLLASEENMYKHRLKEKGKEEEKALDASNVSSFTVFDVANLSFKKRNNFRKRPMDDPSGEPSFASGTSKFRVTTAQEEADSEGDEDADPEFYDEACDMAIDSEDETNHRDREGQKIKTQEAQQEMIRNRQQMAPKTQDEEMAEVPVTRLKDGDENSSRQ